MPQGTLTRADLVAALEELAMPRDDAARVLETMLQLMVDELVDGRPVKLARFGHFSVRDKRARVGRNPKTGEEAPIPSRRVVTFRPSQILREQMCAAGRPAPVRRRVAKSPA